MDISSDNNLPSVPFEYLGWQEILNDAEDSDSLYLNFKCLTLCLTLVVCYFVVLNEIQFKMGSAYFNSQFSLSLNKKRWFKSTAWVSCG